MFVTALTLPAVVRAEDFVLVDQPHGPAPVVVYKDAPVRTRDAAVTLADYIEKISGARPDVIDGEPRPVPERAIWVGMQPVVKKLFPRSDLDFRHPEETLILANGNHLVIAGRDRWNPAHTEAKGRLAMKTGIQQEYGTANAVYTFIRDQLNVRWLWPGEEDVIQSKRIIIAPCERRYHPQIRARAALLQKLSLGDSKEDPGQLWSRYLPVVTFSKPVIGFFYLVAVTDFLFKEPILVPDTISNCRKHLCCQRIHKTCG